MPEPAPPIRAWRRRGPHLLVGGGLLLGYAVLAVLGPWLIPYGANEQDLLGVLAPVSAEHWLGTDQIGRDLLSRLVVGARFTLTAAVVSVAAMLGAVLAFLSARYVFFDVIHRAARTRPRLKRWLTAIDKGLHDHGAYYVLLLRLTPVIPFWAVNLGLGLTRLRLRDYWWATQLGMLPATMVVVNAGASVAEIASLRDLLSWRVIGALGLLPLVPFVLHHSVGRWLRRDLGIRRGVLIGEAPPPP